MVGSLVVESKGPGSNKRKADSEVEKEKAPKQLRGVDHDLMVIVGNQTFYHYSHGLRLASEYFDTMLSMPMQEGQTGVVKFPSRDPSERCVVQRFLDPASARLAQITSRNVEMLVPWFHELQMHYLLAECDGKMCHLFSKYEGLHAEHYANIQKARLQVKELLDKLQFCMKFSMKKAVDKGLTVLRHLLENEACLFDRAMWSHLLKVFDDRDACRRLWPSIRRKLVTDQLRSASAEDILKNPISRDLLMLFLGGAGEMRTRLG